MSIVLLRTLTRKSIIGFGAYKDLTVQNLLDTYRTKELLNLYYTCRNLDFNQDLKDELCISGEREIDKKIQKEERYIENLYIYISWCIKLMMEKREQKQNDQDNLMLYKLKKSKKKTQKMKEYNIARTVYSKGAMKAQNQQNYKK